MITDLEWRLHGGGNVMMSRHKCLAKAEHCEAMARTSNSDLGQCALLALASLWRKLAEQARRFEKPPGGA